MVGRKESFVTMLENCGKKIDRDDPTPFIYQVCLGCTQRAATEVCQKKLMSIVEEEPRKKTNQNTEKVSFWNYDMKGHAEQCVDKDCELANKSVSQP